VNGDDVPVKRGHGRARAGACCCRATSVCAGVGGCCCRLKCMLHGPDDPSSYHIALCMHPYSFCGEDYILSNHILLFLCRCNFCVQLV
jgi:hypothetical protein